MDLSEDSGIWENIIPEFRNEYNIIALICRQMKAPRWNQLAAFIKQTLDEQKIGSCIMIGHSMGGYITLAFAEKYPDMLSKFGLFHSTAYADNDEKRGTKKNVEFIQQKWPSEIYQKHLYLSCLRRIQRKTIQKKLNKWLNVTATLMPILSYIIRIAMMNRPDRTHVLENFKKPVLLSWANTILLYLLSRV